MNYLALDTSFENITAAVYFNGREYSTVYCCDAKRHNAALLGVLEGLLNEAGASVGDMDYFGAVTGPGSFTGIRIGVAAINAMAFSTKKKVVEMTGLELAFEGAEFPTLSLIDCRHGNYYAAYKKDSGAEAEYSEMTEAEISAEDCNKIIVKSVEPGALHSLMRKKISCGRVKAKAGAFYLKKSSAEREAGEGNLC